MQNIRSNQGDIRLFVVEWESPINLSWCLFCVSQTCEHRGWMSDQAIVVELGQMNSDAHEVTRLVLIVGGQIYDICSEGWKSDPDCPGPLCGPWVSLCPDGIVVQ